MCVGPTPTHASRSIKAVLGSTDLLCHILSFCGSRVDIFLKLRRVCKDWSNACNRALQQLPEPRLLCRIAVPLQGDSPQPGTFFRSQLAQLLSTLPTAHVDLGCSLSAHPCVVNFSTTTRLTALAITAMPMLSRLEVTLPTESFAVIDRVLPRSLHLTSLKLLFRDVPDCTGVDEEEEDCSGIALRRALRCLPFLQELTVTKAPITTRLGFDLMKAARCLSPGLTSLDLSFCMPFMDDLAAAALQGFSLHQLEQLASLTCLQRLRLDSPLGEQQHVPPTLSTLTSLELQGHYPMVVNGLGSLVLLRELRLRDVSEWPAGLQSLCWLTRLELRAGSTLNLPVLPDAYVLPLQLQHVELSTDLVSGSLRLPGCFHCLRQLRHLYLDDCELVELPSSLPHLTSLKIRFCSLERGSGRLELAHMSALQHLQVEDCSLSEAPAGLRQLAALTELVLKNNEYGGGWNCCPDESDCDDTMDSFDVPADAGLLGAMYAGRMTDRDLDEDDRIWLGLTCPAAVLSSLAALQRLTICHGVHSRVCHRQHGSKPARRLVQLQLLSFLSIPAPTLSHLTYLQLHYDGDGSEQPWSGLSACLASMPILRHLDVMAHCPCCWPKGITHLQHLMHLSLWCNSHAPPCAPPPFPHPLPQLQALHLGCSAAFSAANSSQPLPFPEKLRTVCPQLSHLVCCLVDGPALVRALPALTGLTELELHHCDLSGEALDLRNLRSLQRACFQGCRISQPPVGLSTLGALTKLELQSNALDYGSKRVVRGQAGCHVDVEF